MSTSNSGLSSIDANAAGTTASTFNAQQYVQQLIQAEEGPEQLMQQQVSNLSAQGTALGTLSSQLDSLQTSVVALNNYQGALTAQDASSSDDSIATASAGAGATSGSHTLVVGNLATTGAYYTSTLADGNTTFGTGSFQLQVGSGTPTTITVNSSNDTLSQLAATINNDSLGVTASVVSDANGARLAVVSNASGTAGNIAISGNTTGLTFTRSGTGNNANYTLDGIALSSASNTVSGAVPGLSLNLLSASASPVTITVTPDASQMTGAIQNFVTAYNTLVQNLNSQFAYSTTGGTNGTGGTGVLGSDSIVQQLQQTMLQDAAYSLTGNGNYPNLASIGVSMNNDGTLSVNTGQLNSAIANDPAAVVNLFQQSTGAPGLAQNFMNDLINWTNPTGGPLATDQNGITQSTTALNQQITDFQNNLNSQQQSLLQVYSQVEVTLQEMPTLLSQVESQLNSI